MIFPWSQVLKVGPFSSLMLEHQDIPVCLVDHYCQDRYLLFMPILYGFQWETACHTRGKSCWVIPKMQRLSLFQAPTIGSCLPSLEKLLFLNLISHYQNKLIETATNKPNKYRLHTTKSVHVPAVDNFRGFWLLDIRHLWMPADMAADKRWLVV